MPRRLAHVSMPQMQSKPLTCQISSLIPTGLDRNSTAPASYRLAAKDYLALVGQIRIDVQPRCSAVAQEVDPELGVLAGLDGLGHTVKRIAAVAYVGMDHPRPEHCAVADVAGVRRCRRPQARNLHVPPGATV